MAGESVAGESVAGGSVAGGSKNWLQSRDEFEVTKQPPGGWK